MQAELVFASDSTEAQVKNGPIEGAQVTTTNIISRDVTLRSIVESLASKGLEIEPDHCISFQDPAKSLYVFIGKASDQDVLNSYTLPASAFSQGSFTDGSGQPAVLTLLLRRGSGVGQKQPSANAVEKNADCQKRLIDDSQQ